MTESTITTVGQLAANAAGPASFATAYFERLKCALDGIDVGEISRFAEELDAARQEGRSIFVAGNGGSATTATSMANDLGFDIIRKTATEMPFRVHSLTDNNAVLTAISNDVGYEDVFVNQLRVHYQSGDRLVVISASGNSPNIVRAAKWVKTAGGTVLSMVGFDGGALRDLSDIVVHVPSQAGEYGPVEDAHLAVNHVLAHWFQVRLRVG
ncbi:MAG: SIS domain-containing protein [Gemmatimonadota bacterium]|nr:SIS domain-containing protein [Gemmatimonadota bacterium]